MSCNGYTIKLPIEDLILNLDKKYILSSNIAKYLTIFQLNGVRYLYENYAKNKSCILNDESGLGKTVQVIGFLYALLTSINNKSMRKQSNIYLIICKNIDRVKHWYYHFDILINNKNIKINILNDQSSSTETASTKNNNKTTFNKYLLNNLINITTWKYLFKNIENFTKISINYLILDERDDEPKFIQNNEHITLYNYLEKLKIKYKLIILTKDITRNKKYFYEVLQFLQHSDRIGKLSHDDFNKRFQINLKTDNNLTIIAKRQDILNFSENIRLRRYQRQFLKELPLIESKIFQQHFRNWELEKFGYCSNSEILLQNNNKCIENIEQYVSDVGTVINNNRNNNNNNNSNKNINKNNISYSGCSSSSTSDINNKYLAFEKLRLEISLKNKSEMMFQSFDDKTTNLSMSPLLFESESEDEKLRLQIQNNNINIINVNNNNVVLNTQENYNKNKQIFQVFTNVHNIAKKLNYSTIQSGTLNRTPLTKTTTIKIKTPPPSLSSSTTKLTKKRSFSEPLLQNMDNKQINTDKVIALDINDNCINSEYMLNNEQQYLINNIKRKFKHFNNNNNNNLINSLNKINSIDDVNDVDNNNNVNSDNNSKEVISNSQPFLKNINNNKTNSGQNLFDTMKINKNSSNQPPSDDLQTLKYDFNLNIDINDILTSNQRKLSSNDVEILSIENNTIWISSTSNATTIDKSLKLEKSQFNVIESPELFDDDLIINFSNCNNSNNNNNQEIIENYNNDANDKSINCFEITSNNIFSNKLRILKTEPMGSCVSRQCQRVSSFSRSSLSPIKKSTTFSGLTIVNKRKIDNKIMATTTTTTTTSKAGRQMFRKYQHRNSMSSKKKNFGDNTLIQLKKRKISDVKSSNDKNNTIILSSSISSSFSDNN